MSIRTIYVMSEESNHSYCKIGKDGNWPFRFKQASSHNPFKLQVNAAWHFPELTNKEIIQLEATVQSGLEPLTGSIVSEWYALNPTDAVALLTERLQRPPDETVTPDVPIYNDWGESNCTKQGQTYKSRIWIYSEDVPNGRVKVGHGILFDTNFKYNFTYNPRPVYLRACMELGVSFGGPSPLLQENNETIQEIWETTTLRFGDGPHTHSLGWLHDGVSVSDVVSLLRSLGMVRYDLALPKPADARPRDPSVPPIPFGVVPPQYRVKPL